jgi:hypothetical protein
MMMVKSEENTILRGKTEERAKEAAATSVLFSIFNSFDFSTKPWIRDQ